VSRAREDLGRDIANLDPLKASRAPARKWPQPFLGYAFGRRGSLEQIVFDVSPLLGPLPATVSGGPVVWARAQSELIVDYARAVRRPLPTPSHNESVSEPALAIELNTGARPVKRPNPPFPKGLKRISYQCGSYRKGCRNCGEIKIARTRTVYTSGYAVFRAYAPNETGWTFWCYECGARDQQCWANCEEELGRAAIIRPNAQFQIYKTDKKVAAAKPPPIPDQSRSRDSARRSPGTS
jgi:hypothetical protein